jgi:DNA primase
MPSDAESQASWALQRAANAEEVAADQNKVCSYVKSELFERVVFIWDKSSLDRGGKLHEDYLKNCRPLLASGGLLAIRDEEAELYMNLLWDMMKKDQCYVDWLISKRSNTYQAMQDRFMSKSRVAKGLIVLGPLEKATHLIDLYL